MSAATAARSVRRSAAVRAPRRLPDAEALILEAMQRLHGIGDKQELARAAGLPLDAAFLLLVEDMAQWQLLRRAGPMLGFGSMAHRLVA